MKEIAIEQMLFGDWCIAVYENQELLLDKKYFVNDYNIARAVANKLKEKEEYKDFEITQY